MAYWKQTCVLLMILFSAIGVSLASDETDLAATNQSTTTQPAGKPIRVATYNINYGNPNLPLVVKAIRECNADVVALQETNPESIRYLQKYLRTEYPFMQYRHAKAAGGFAFLSKRPLKKTTYLPPTHGWFGTYLTTIEIAKQDVCIANLHLQPTIPQRGDTISTFLQRWIHDEGIRNKEMAAIFSKLPNNMPLIVCGDFNSLPETSATRHLESRGLIDSQKNAGKNEASKPTWHWTLGRRVWRFRLDYIFHNKWFRCSNCRVLPYDASDHFLVVTTLLLDPTKKRNPTDQKQPTAPNLPSQQSPRS